MGGENAGSEGNVAGGLILLTSGSMLVSLCGSCSFSPRGDDGTDAPKIIRPYN